jgi:hypothetical protein
MTTGPLQAPQRLTIASAMPWPSSPPQLTIRHPMRHQGVRWEQAMADAHQNELQRLEPGDEGEVAGTTTKCYRVW